MKRESLYLSTIDERAHLLAKQYGLGLEIAEFSTAWNLDDQFEETNSIVGPKLKCSDRFVMHGPYSELFPSAVDPKIRAVAAERFRQTIALARRYGIRKLVFHGGYNPKLYFTCWFKEQSEIFWREFVSEIPEDMVICIENVLEETPDMLADMIRRINDPRIRMCLDVGHAHAYSQCSPEEWAQACADIIAHLHIHNNDQSWDTHSPLDCGTIPMKQLLHRLDTLCPQASITLELMEAESSVKWLLENSILEGSL